VGGAMAQETASDLECRLAQAERQLSEALERQAATDEILRVISTARTDVQPVFEMIVRSAVALAAACLRTCSVSTVSCCILLLATM
jgi:hypothetical protein